MPAQGPLEEGRPEEGGDEDDPSEALFMSPRSDLEAFSPASGRSFKSAASRSMH